MKAAQRKFPAANAWQCARSRSNLSAEQTPRTPRSAACALSSSSARAAPELSSASCVALRFRASFSRLSASCRVGVTVAEQDGEIPALPCQPVIQRLDSLLQAAGSASGVIPRSIIRTHLREHGFNRDTEDRGNA
eukprot:CAMPEP_0179939980 /NCGR_PEP_ID=MMETSP0983-20121128/16024_1 /TAXON_ID=483367 /ORGANISM="non described non described, Strain CCMP 2436" /LENGTH=134 /DNA_ID=CAMNT_0021846555 /DNA_START=202 /DNA_END=606 /DNA_ORIENTATION=-